MSCVVYGSLLGSRGWKRVFLCAPRELRDGEARTVYCPLTPLAPLLCFAPSCGPGRFPVSRQNGYREAVPSGRPSAPLWARFFPGRNTFNAPPPRPGIVGPGGTRKTGVCLVLCAIVGGLWWSCSWKLYIIIGLLSVNFIIIINY